MRWARTWRPDGGDEIDGGVGDDAGCLDEQVTRVITHPAGHSPTRTTDLVASYKVQCRPFRELLIRYLDERAPTLDYASLRGVGIGAHEDLWTDLELHNPGRGTLDLPESVVVAWKQRVRARFKNPWSIFIVVRTFYLDMARCSMDVPYWVSWAVRSTVTAADVRGPSKYDKQKKSRMYQRIRSLAPHFPTLVRAAHDLLEFESGLLAAVRAIDPGARFTCHGKTFVRIAVTAPNRGGFRPVKPSGSRFDA